MQLYKALGFERLDCQEHGVPFRKWFISYLPVLFLLKLTCLRAARAEINLKLTGNRVGHRECHALSDWPWSAGLRMMFWC